MSFLFQNRCYSTTEQLAEATATSCEVVSGGQFIRCVPNVDGVGVDVSTLEYSTGNVLTTAYFSPPQIACELPLTDFTTFIWQLAGTLVAGYAIRCMIQVFRMR